MSLAIENPDVGVAVAGPPDSHRQLVRWAPTLNAFADLDDVNAEQEAYLSHFTYGSEMTTHYRANGRSVRGFSGPCRAKWLVFDIDRTELASALADTKRLASFLRERFPEIGDVLPVYFSGRKGFHVYLELPEVEFLPENALVAKTLAMRLASAAGVAVDGSIYDVNRIIRLPNTRHVKSGLYKRRIDADDLMTISVEQVLQRAKTPAGDGIKSVGQCRLPKIREEWEAAKRHTTELRRVRVKIRQDFEGEVRAPKYLIDFIRFETPQGERATTLFRCAAVLTEMGCPAAAVYALLDEPGRDNGLSPAEVRRQIGCGINHAQRQMAGERVVP